MSWSASVRASLLRRNDVISIRRNVALLSLSVALWNAPSFASWELRVDEPSCVSEDKIRHGVERLLGEMKASEGLRVAVTARSEREVVLLSLEMWVNGESFTRQVEVPSCEEAEKAAALILALAIRPDLQVPEQATETGGPPPAESKEADATPIEAPPPPVDPGPVPKAPDRQESIEDDPEVPARLEGPSATPQWNVTLALGYALSALSLPKVGHGVELGLGIGRARFRGELYGLFQPGIRIEMAPGDRRGASLTLWHVGMRACYVMPFRPAASNPQLEGGLCALGETGEFRASGFGSETVRTANDIWGAVGGGGVLGAGIGGAGVLRLGASALVPTFRNSYAWSSGDGLVEIASTSQVFVRFEAALVLTL
jgi:hypothetical protein